jgi:tRNA-dihydrouridine synthase 1
MVDPAGYVKSEKYRQEFPFFEEDRPLCVQFGGSDPATLTAAVALVREHPSSAHPPEAPSIRKLTVASACVFWSRVQVAPHCDAVELNCGCPQRCARQGGYGAFLMEAPELLESLVKAMAGAVRTANQSLRSNAPSVIGAKPPHRVALFIKMRVFDDVAATVKLALMVEAAGADLLTVHGRTRQQVRGG